MKFKFNEMVIVKSSHNDFYNNAIGVVFEVYGANTLEIRYNVELKSRSQIGFFHIFAEDELEHYAYD